MEAPRQVTADGGIHMLAGSTLGGGTVINYTTSFPTLPSVRREWDRLAGFDEVFDGDGFVASLASVATRLGTNRDNGDPSERDRILAAVQQQADTAGKVDWSVHFVDGTVIRAYQHAAGAKGGRQKRRRWVRARVASARKCPSRPRGKASR